MEDNLIKPGKPMDDATWVKYLNQGNVPIKIYVKGRVVVDYDLMIVIQNTGKRFGGWAANVHFGNFFKMNRQTTSIAIVSGKPFKSEQIVGFINPTVDHISIHAIGLEISGTEDKLKVRTGKSDRTRLVTELLTVAAEVGQPIQVPSKLLSYITIKISFIPVKEKPFYILKIDSLEKRNSGEVEDKKSNSRYESKFITKITAHKEKPDTDILDKIDKATASRGLIRIMCTPTMAEDMMMRNINNRHLRNETVFKYDVEMKADGWEWTNESTVGFDKEGKLRDGQHRLLAIIKSGTTQELVIFTGLSHKAFPVLNTGRSRTLGDTLSVKEIPDANQSAATVSFIMNYTKYGVVNVSNRKGKGVTNKEMGEWVSNETNYNRMKAAITLSNTTFMKYGKKYLSKTLWAGLYFLFSAKHKAQAEEFLTRLATGEYISRNDNTSSISVLRNVLINWGDIPKLQPTGRSVTQRVRYVITAWNHYRNNEIIKVLKVETQDAPLPKII